MQDPKWSLFCCWLLRQICGLLEVIFTFFSQFAHLKAGDNFSIRTWLWCWLLPREVLLLLVAIFTFSTQFVRREAGDKLFESSHTIWPRYNFGQLWFLIFFQSLCYTLKVYQKGLWFAKFLPISPFPICLCRIVYVFKGYHLP